MANLDLVPTKPIGRNNKSESANQMTSKAAAATKNGVATTITIKPDNIKAIIEFLRDLPDSTSNCLPLINAKCFSTEITQSAVALTTAVTANNNSSKLSPQQLALGRAYGRLLIEIVDKYTKCHATSNNNADAVSATTSDDAAAKYDTFVAGLQIFYQLCSAFYSHFTASTNVGGAGAAADSDDDEAGGGGFLNRLNRVENANSTDALDFVPPQLLYLFRFSNITKFTDRDDKVLKPLIRYIRHPRFTLDLLASQTKQNKHALRVRTGGDDDDDESEEEELLDIIPAAASYTELKAFDSNIIAQIVSAVKVFLLRIALKPNDTKATQNRALKRLASIMTANILLCEACHEIILVRLRLLLTSTSAKDDHMTTIYGRLYKMAWLMLDQKLKRAINFSVYGNVDAENADENSDDDDANDDEEAPDDEAGGGDDAAADGGVLDTPDVKRCRQTRQALREAISDVIYKCTMLSNASLNLLLGCRAMVRAWREVAGGTRSTVNWKAMLYSNFEKHLKDKDASPSERVQCNFLWLMAVLFPLLKPTWSAKDKQKEAEAQLKMITNMLMSDSAEVRHDAISTCTAILRDTWQLCTPLLTRQIIATVVQLCFDQHNTKVRLQAVQFFIELIKKRETHAELRKPLNSLKALINDPCLSVVERLLQLYEEIARMEQQQQQQNSSDNSSTTMPAVVRLRDACDLAILMSMFNTKTLMTKTNRRRPPTAAAAVAAAATTAAATGATAREADDVKRAQFIAADVAAILRNYLIPAPPANVFTDTSQFYAYRSDLLRRCLQLQVIDRTVVLNFYETIARLASSEEFLDKCDKFFGKFAAATAPVAEKVKKNDADDDDTADDDDDDDHVTATDDNSSALFGAKKRGKKSKAKNKTAKSIKRAKSTAATNTAQQPKKTTRRTLKKVQSEQQQKTNQNESELRLQAPRDEVLLIITAFASGFRHVLMAVTEATNTATAGGDSVDADDENLQSKIAAVIAADTSADATAASACCAKTLDETQYLLQIITTMWEAAGFSGLHTQLSERGKHERYGIICKCMQAANVFLQWPACWQQPIHSSLLSHALTIPLTFPRAIVFHQEKGIMQQMNMLCENLYKQVRYGQQRHVAQLICKVLWRNEPHRAVVVNFLYDCVVQRKTDTNTIADISSVAATLPTISDNNSTAASSGGKRSMRSSSKNRTAAEPAAAVAVGNKKRGKKSAALAVSVVAAEDAENYPRQQLILTDAAEQLEASFIAIPLLHLFLSNDYQDRNAFFRILGQQRVRILHEVLLSRLQSAVLGRVAAAAGTDSDADDNSNDDFVQQVLLQLESGSRSKNSSRSKKRAKKIIKSEADDKKGDENELQPQDAAAAAAVTAEAILIDEHAVLNHVIKITDIVSGFSGGASNTIPATPRGFVPSSTSRTMPRDSAGEETASDNNQTSAIIAPSLEQIERELVAEFGWRELIECLVGMQQQQSQAVDSQSTTASQCRARMLMLLNDMRVPPSLKIIKNATTTTTAAKPTDAGVENEQQTDAAAAKTTTTKSRGGRQRRAASKIQGKTADHVDEKPEIVENGSSSSEILRKRIATTLATCMCEIGTQIANNVELNAGFFNGFQLLLFLLDDIMLSSSIVMQNAATLAQLIKHMIHQAYCLTAFLEKRRENAAVVADQQEEQDAAEKQKECGSSILAAAAPAANASISVNEAMLNSTEDKITMLVQHAAKLLAHLLFARHFIDVRWLKTATANDERKFNVVIEQARKSIDSVFQHWSNAWVQDDSHRVLVLQELQLLLTRPQNLTVLADAVDAGDDVGKRVAGFWSRCAVDWPQDKQKVMTIVDELAKALNDFGHQQMPTTPLGSGNTLRYKWIKQFSSSMLLYSTALTVTNTTKQKQQRSNNNNNINKQQ